MKMVKVPLKTNYAQINILASSNIVNIKVEKNISYKNCFEKNTSTEFVEKYWGCHLKKISRAFTYRKILIFYVFSKCVF